ncbi:MAG: sensor histidine kinase [Xanthomonadaceae bacterium]|jgi:signal transduction histidine kinase|nr:sensor histidine kinase [Xanthomonadaceae bacterium]
MSRSLRARLLWSALLPLALLAAAGACGLQWAFAGAVERGYDERLAAKLDALVAGLDIEADGRPSLQRAPDEAAFAQVRSGWYWQVAQDGQPLLRSRSLWDAALEAGPADTALRASDAIGPGGEALRVVGRRVLLPGAAGPLDLAVAGPRAGLDAEIARLGRLLWGGVAGLVLLAAAGLAVQVQLGLAPLRRLGAQVAAVRRGEADGVEAGRLRELAALADELNGLLRQNGRLAEHGRKRAGDLAHALKTPLALLRTRIDPSDGELREALDRIGAVVDRHLAAASADARRAHARCDAVAEARQLLGMFARLHSGRPLQLRLDAPERRAVGMEASDLHELLGNLVDNACRAAHSQVRLAIEPGAGPLRLCIEDDGPGLADAQLAQLGQRGLRFDERLPGTGLGVAISRDIVDSYGGRLDFEHRPGGGLRAVLELPAAPGAA